MVTPIFNGTVIKGKPVPIDKEKYLRHCCRLEGKEIEIIIRRRYNRKSNQQNRYYRGVVVELIAEYCGYDSDRAHGVLQEKFFKIVPEEGEPYIRSTRLSEWDTMEWEMKMDEIRRWASEFLGLYIPEPNEVEL